MSTKNEPNNKHSGATVLQRSELKKRQEHIQDGQKVEPITQNGFYYHMRKIFLSKGIDPEKQGRHFRRNMTNAINKLCKGLHTTREDLMIYASSRAFLYFRGERIPVSLATMEDNIKKGTDILIIEKEGISDDDERFLEDEQRKLDEDQKTLDELEEKKKRMHKGIITNLTHSKAPVKDK